MKLPNIRLSHLSIAFLTGFIFLSLSGCSRPAAATEETPPPAPVKWMEARQFFIEEWTELIGTTQPLPDRAARITAPVEGRVVSVLLDPRGQPIAEGQRVSKGEFIAQLDDIIARANRDKVEAQQEELKQQVEQSKLGVKLADVELRRLQALNKEKSTGGQPLVPDIEVEKAGLLLDESKAKQRGAELHASGGEKKLKALNEQLRLFALTAPIDGQLGRLQVVKGQTISPGTIIAEIVNVDDAIDFLCFVPPPVARLLKEGQPARIGGIADPDAKNASVEGKVAFIAEQAEVDTGNFAVKVRFPNQDAKLRGNVTMRLRVLTTPGKACLTLPEKAILEDRDPPGVIVVEDYKQEKDKDGKEIETGKARILRAKLGIRDRVLGLVEIVSVDDPEKKWQGSLDTAKFVVEKGQGLQSGDPIKLEVEEDEEPAEPKKEP